MKQKSFIILLVVVIVLGGIIGGAFAGGIAIGKNQGREEVGQDLQSQIVSRFGDRDFPQGTFQPGMGGLIRGAGAMGTVEEVEGNVVTLNTTEGTVSVLVDDDTLIQKMGEGSLDDISPGESITVSGEPEDNGDIKATSIFITPLFVTQ